MHFFISYKKKKHSDGWCYFFWGAKTKKIIIVVGTIAS